MQIEVSPQDPPERLDLYLSRRLQDTSRAQIQRLIKAHAIRLNDQPTLASYKIQPGDCIAFHFLTVHGAPGNPSQTARRRAFAARFTGDDATYAVRDGEMSPPFPEVTLTPGDAMDCETFPVLLEGTTSDIA
mgnify:CR=1 FL=1